MDKNIKALDKDKRVRINSIDLFRLLSACLVVSIHTHPFEDQNEVLGYIFVQVLPRIAVPFFFCVSGYFFINRLESGEKCVLKTFLKALKVYIIWSVFYSIVNIILSIINHTFEPISYAKNFIINFFFFGSYYHLWYCIALIASILIVGIFYKLKMQKVLVCVSIILYIIGLLGESYYQIGNQIPGISWFVNFQYFTEIRRVLLMGLPFFVSGYFVTRLLPKTSKRITIGLTFVCFVFYVAELVILHITGISKSIVITIFLYPILLCVILLLLNFPFSNRSDLASNCKSLAGYMFFIHPFWIIIIRLVCDMLDIKLLNILTYIIVIIICFISWLVLKKLNLPFVKKYVLGLRV